VGTVFDGRRLFFIGMGDNFIKQSGIFGTSEPSQPLFGYGVAGGRSSRKAGLDEPQYGFIMRDVLLPCELLNIALDLRREIQTHSSHLWPRY